MAVANRNFGSGVIQFQADAAGQQQDFCDKRADREFDGIDRRDDTSLNTKLAFTLYSRPYEYCEDNEKNTIRQHKTILRELSGSGDINFACIHLSFLCSKTRNAHIIPIIRTQQTYGDKVYFIDEPGFVYEGWETLLNSKDFPPGHLCFPKDGVYTATKNRVDIEWRETKGKTVMKVIDTVSNVAKVTSTGILAASLFFPALTPAVVAAEAALVGSTTWSVSRQANKLAKRKQLHKSISLMDESSRAIWLSMCNEVLGAALMSGATRLPCLVAGGRLTAETASLTMELMCWTSVGANAFGILSNIATALWKYKHGELHREDIYYFISSCIFVSNLILTSAVANEVMHVLSSRPSLMTNFLNMAANRAFCTVKTMITGVSVAGAIEILCGKLIQDFLQLVGMPFTATVIRSVLDILQKFKQGTLNVVTLCFELHKVMFNFMGKVTAEVKEALEKIRKIFGRLSNAVIINGRQLFENTYITAPEITRSIDRAIDSIEVHDATTRENMTKDLMGVVVELAQTRNLRIQNERQFADVCNIFMNDFKAKCTRKVVFRMSTRQRSQLSEDDKLEIFNEVIAEVQKQIRVLSKPLTEMNDRPIVDETFDPGELHLRPLFEIDNVETYAFQTNYEFAEFNQFIYDASCQLLSVDDECFTQRACIHAGFEQIIVIELREKTVVFNYEKQKNTNQVLGLALLVKA